MTTAAQLSGATAAQVQAARTALAEYVQALYPALSVRVGPLADLVLGPAADALAALDVRAEAIEASLDPEQALADGGYDADLLATTLAGRGVTRGTAATATGSAGLIFSDDVQRTVPAGFRFVSADGVSFKTTASVRFLVSTTTTTPFSTDAVLIADPAGGYIGVVALTAEATGASGNRPAGTALSAITTLTHLTAAFVVVDLAGGADAETDAALLARLPAATAPRTTASRDGAAGVVQAAAAFSCVTTLGFGDAAMVRGRSVLTSQTPGRLDVRVRVADAPSRLRLAVTATLIGTTGPSGIWRFALAPEDAPGWYQIEKVLQTANALTAAGYVPSLVTPGYDTSSSDSPPDIRAAADAVLSAYATATVTFTDTDTSLSGLTVGVSTRNYDAVVRLIPGIGAAQAACDAPAVTPAGGDCLVRAAVPVAVSLSVSATTAPGVTVTADEIAAAVAAAINASAIDNQLSAATVTANAQARLSAGTALLLSALQGTVYPVASVSFVVTGTGALSVTTDYLAGLGPDTVAFYADPEDLTVTIT